VFRHLPDVDFYPQAIDEFTAEPEIAAAYDVVLFYTMHRFQPGDELPWYQEKLFSTLEQLGRKNQGIGILHHSLVAFPQWSFWSELVGIAERETIQAHWGETVSTQVQDAQHPITQGITGWTMRDETYQMAEPEDDGNNHILLTTNHPKSMKALAWTRTFVAAVSSVIRLATMPLRLVIPIFSACSTMPCAGWRNAKTIR
jgi:hypothetical protein